MAIRDTKMHAVSPRENLDRAAFIIAFGVGIVGGIILKLAGAHPFLAAGFSAIVLVSYALVAWAGGRVKIEPEAIGDNCYYLGFLFTLASLSFTLYQMADPSTTGGKPVDIPEVISGFGVALSSTIFGVFLRVLMMQMRPDFVAKDRAVRSDLNKSYGDFRKNLSGVLSQMKAFSTESIQYAAERDKRLRDSTESFVEDHQAALQAAADQLSKNIETAFTEASQKAIGEITASMVEANKESQKAIQELVADIKALKNLLNEQETESYEELAARRKQLNAELASAETQVKNHTEAMLEHIKVTRRSADSMSKRIGPALDALKERLDALPRFSPDGLPEDAPFEAGVAPPLDNPENLQSVVDKPFTVKLRSGPWTNTKSDT
ncbi:hypothetical protein [Pseudophaeobacter sp. TrK17]|uniref:hypothetical protein n=1 Tax=Pseudophaeobacter sp. TrK17 TaxID=2815167 RepID=UPI0035CFA3C1